MLCRTGLVWKSIVDNQLLTFRLIGVNNQNFIMEDEQTGTWWQQVTGKAIQGPLAGKRLEQMFFEQVTWELWSRENPHSTVLESRPEFVESYWRETEDEETRTDEFMDFPVEADPEDEVELGELIFALRLPDGREKAYPMRLLREQSPVLDRFAGRDILIVVGEDDRSVRAFDRVVDGKTLEFYQLLSVAKDVSPEVEIATTAEDETDTTEKPREPIVLVDAETKSEWDFTGLATSGELAGTRLWQLQVYADYWFDWKRFNPEGLVFAAGDIGTRDASGL